MEIGPTDIEMVVINSENEHIENPGEGHQWNFKLVSSQKMVGMLHLQFCCGGTLQLKSI